ncbi:MAG: NUDIX domain-containing protein [Proteobacteria bacterium]|nr:NUDIX domain-containing protein [Pseudomonadota bacterium]
MYLINKKQEHLYRPNVGCVLIKGDRIFVAKRLGYTADAWQMPQGGVDGNEQFEEALLRELNEEIGTDNIDILQKSSYFRYYKVPSKVSMQAWGGRYIGQKQQWFLARAKILTLTFKPKYQNLKNGSGLPQRKQYTVQSFLKKIYTWMFFRNSIYIKN